MVEQLKCHDRSNSIASEKKIKNQPKGGYIVIRWSGDFYSTTGNIFEDPLYAVAAGTPGKGNRMSLLHGAPSLRRMKSQAVLSPGNMNWQKC